MRSSVIKFLGLVALGGVIISCKSNLEQVDKKNHNNKVIENVNKSEPEGLIVNVFRPGSLRSLMKDKGIFSGDKLVITGTINDNDMEYLKDSVKFKSVDLGKATFVELNIETSPGSLCFTGCRWLEDVVLPKNISTIPSSAFMNTNLKSIVIPKNILHIENFVFYSCHNLKSVVFPNSLESIGNAVFAGCNSLEAVTIPDSITSIGRSAFMGCTSLKSMFIPNSVTRIKESTFDSCTSLRSITIPNSITSIGKQAFYKCVSLTSVLIPHSVMSIDDLAFCFFRGNVIIDNNNPNSIKLGNNVFASGTYDNYVEKSEAKLYVPASAVDAYKNSPKWKAIFGDKIYPISE